MHAECLQSPRESRPYAAEPIVLGTPFLAYDSGMSHPGSSSLGRVGLKRFPPCRSGLCWARCILHVRICTHHGPICRLCHTAGLVFSLFPSQPRSSKASLSRCAALERSCGRLCWHHGGRKYKSSVASFGYRHFRARTSKRSGDLRVRLWRDSRDSWPDARS